MWQCVWYTNLVNKTYSDRRGSKRVKFLDAEYVKYAETHRQRIKHKRYTQYQSKTNSEIFQNHALDIMSRITEPHVAMTAK